MISATEQADAQLQRAVAYSQDLLTDSDGGDRFNKRECKVCYYTAKHHGRMAGQAITTTQCGICRKELTFSDTAVDRLCVECAKQHLLCKHCGGDIHLRTRRRKWPYITSSE